MVSDVIADMIVRLKNAQMAGEDSTLVPYSQFKETIADTLKQAGFIKSVNKKGKKVKKYLEAELIYSASRQPKITGIARVSKPSRRIYHRASQIRAVRQGYGIAVYSTPKGVMTDKQAREAKVGGEILFKIW